ncbi:hypothetical protein FIBSPDRAFT_584242 [Athelia psychrophila]|uniref:Uncharacterized protein n=1 Tax=Athelia psychrophila TaxID=1759441 RepID=A0A166HFG0_9AGAM|nr:hypothetical protein FIBSPDRAFT_584242 [Fibularhizoctonia sp. CBS 109695]
MARGHLSTFLQALSAPLLETPFLRDQDFSKPLPPAHFPALRCLVITFDFIRNSASIIKLAMGCLHITHLKYASRMLRYLQPIFVTSEVNASGVSFPAYWPNLQTLSLPSYMQGEEALQMVLSRNDARGRLQKPRVGMEDTSILNRDIWRTVNDHAEVVGIYEDYLQ